MTDADLTRPVDLDLLISSLRGEASIADRPGQYDRLHAAADVVVDALEYIRRLTAERDALAAQLDALRAIVSRPMWWCSPAVHEVERALLGDDEREGRRS